MRHRTVTTLVLALALAASLAPAARAEFGLGRPAAKPAARVQALTLSGRCSGPIGADMRIDDLVYRVSPDARIFELGRGVVPSGTAYFDRVVTVTAQRVRGTLVVTSVLVRPAPLGSRNGGAGVMEDRGPR